MSRLSASGPHRASLWRRLRPRENAATLLRGARTGALALAALAVLAVGMPEHAEAQTAVLVSNTGQGDDDDSSSTRDRALAFTTGSNSGGYTLSSVDIISEDSEGDDASVSVCTVDGSGYPTTTCTALTAPSAFAAGTLTFTASPGMPLTSTTTYTVVIGTPGGENLTLDSTTSNGEDTGAAAGWSLANSFDFKTTLNEWRTTASGESPRIAIKGTLGGTNTAPTVATEIPNQTAMSGTAFSYQVPAATFADADGDTLTYTAMLADDTALPSWLSFTAATRTFSGTPTAAETVSVKVTASDASDSVSDTFDIVVSAAVPGSATVLVSNVGLNPSTDSVASFDFAQSFRTGANATGYTLTSIELLIKRSAATPPTVKLFSVSATGTELATFTGPATLAGSGTANFTFTPASPVILLRSTTYWLVVEGATGWKLVVSYAEDGTSATGWSIGDGYGFRAASSTGGFTTSTSGTWMFRVNGTTGGVTNTAPTVATEIPNQTAMSGTVFSYQVPAATFADADSDTLTYTATLADDTMLPSWLSFTAATRTFSGTPTTAETVSVKVTASDGTDSVSDTFDIVVSAAANNAPVFATDTTSRSFFESVGNSVFVSPESVGAVVTATDADGDTLTYSLEGTDAAKFGIVSSSGLIRTKVGENYDREVKDSYSVTVKADDSNGGTDTIMVTITVNNFAEKPIEPAMPTVTATSGSTTSLDVSWTAPNNVGRPAITGYKVEYRAGVSGNWITHAHAGTGRTTTIDGLTAATAYQVQVLAVNSDGDGAFSSPGAGTTGTPTNTAPTVANPIDDQTATVGTALNFAFPANTFADTDTGDTLTYTATKSDDSALPSWLSFAAATRTFSGTPLAADVGTVSVKVTASDGNGGSVSDTFDIVVSAAADTTPPEVESVTVPISGAEVELVFDEDLDETVVGTLLVSVFSLTVAGQAVTIRDYEIRAMVLALYVQAGTIKQGQTVVLSYTDPTAGDDTVALQDIAGNDVASFTTGMSGVPAVTNNSTNTAPTGAPTITGTAQVGQTLTAVTTGIADANGLTSPGYTYQWIRANGTEADIASANSSTYILVAADLGKTIKVKVSFTDDASNAETLTSAATATVVAAPTAPMVTDVDVTSTPDSADTYGTGEMIQFTVTFDQAVTVTGTPEFEFCLGSSATVSCTVGMPPPALRSAALLSGSGTTALVFSYTVVAGDVDDNGIYAGDQSETIKLDGGDTIQGTVGGLTAVLTHDAVGTPTGHKVNGAAANTAPTAANNTVTTAEDRAYTFTAADFGFMDADAGAALASVKIVTTPALGTLALDGTAVVALDDVTKAQIDGGMLIFTPARDAHGVAYTTFTFKVNDGTDDSASAYTMTIDVTDAPAPVCTAPSFGDRRQIWTGTVTVGTGGTFFHGFDTSFLVGTLVGTLDDTTFDIGPNTYNVKGVYVLDSNDLFGGTSGGDLKFILNEALRAEEMAALRLHVCDTPYDFSAAVGTSGSHTWADDLDWSPPVVTRTVYLSLPANNVATGEPAITGTAQVGQVLTADASPIADDDGLPSSFTYKWFRVDSDGTSNEAEISGEIATTYTLTNDDAGKKIKVKVSFTDELSGEEMRTSAAYPSSGTVTTAGTNTAPMVTDVDVTSMPASGDTYGIGEMIRVTVTFDQNVTVVGTPEFEFCLGSSSTMSCSAGMPPPALRSAAYVSGSGTTMLVFSYTVVAGDMDDNGIWIGNLADTLKLDAADTIEGTMGGLTAVLTHAEEGPQTGHKVDGGAPTVPPDPTPPTLVLATATTLTIEWTHPGDGGSPLTRNFIEYRVDGTTAWTNWYRGETPTPVTRTVIRNLAAATAYDVRVHSTNAIGNSQWVQSATAFSTRANNAATGEPSITGTATVGQDLTATTGTIADDDGLPSSFTYQWVRVDADGTSNPVDITDATAATYTLTADDEGKKVKVKVSFTDDLDSTETRTSAAYPSSGTVTTNTAPTGADNTVTTGVGTAYAFTADDFGFADDDAGDTLASVKIVTVPDEGTLALAGTDVTLNDVVTKAQIDGEMLTFTPVAGASGTGYASFTFKVSDGTADSASAYTMTIDVTAAPGTNTAPTAANNTVTTAEDTVYTFEADDFRFMDADPGDTLAIVKIWSSQWRGTLALDGVAINWYAVVTKAQIDGKMLTFTPARDAHRDHYGSFRFKVNDGTDDSTFYGMRIDVTDTPAPVCGVPSFGDRRNIWTGTVTVGTYRFGGSPLDFYGYKSSAPPSGDLDDQTFTIGSNDYTIVLARVALGGSNSGELLFEMETGQKLTTVEVAALRLHVCDTTVYNFSDATNSRLNSYGWSGSLDWSHPVVTRTVYLSLPANNDATGEPAITGTATVGQELTATTGTIADDDGLPSSFTYQWVRVDADGTSNPADITDANAATYTLTDDAGKKIKVKVSFTDELSGVEMRTSAAYPSSGTVTAAAGTPTGAPTITGTAQVGETLTAVTTGIADADGLTSPTYTYQWIRVNGTDADISGANSSTYPLVTADLGKTIKVRVTFDDDDGNTEMLTSASYPSSGTVTMDVTLPSLSSATVQGMVLTLVYDEPLDPASTPAPRVYILTVKATVGTTTTNTETRPAAVSVSGSRVTLTLDTAPAAGARVTLLYLVWGVNPVQDVAGNDALPFGVHVMRGNPPPPTNTPPVVANPLADQEVTVDVPFTYVVPADAFTDADGNPLTYTAALSDGGMLPSWLTFDPATRTFTGTPAPGDGGTVRVTVTASDGTATVSDEFALMVTVGNTAPTAVHNTVTTAEDRAYTFTAADFGFMDADAGAALASVKIVTVPALGILALDGTAVLVDAVVTKAQIDGDMLTFTPARDAHGAPYTTFTFKVNDGTDDSASAYTMTIDVTDAPNTAPTAVHNTVTTAEDTAYAFTADDFGFADTDAGATLASVKIVTLPAVGTLAHDGTAVLVDAVVTKADIDDNKLTFTPVAGASGTGYASFTFKVNDGTDDSASAYTMTIDVAELPAITIAADRDKATGKIDWVHYTLTREGDTAAALTVTVTFVGSSGNDWSLDPTNKAMREVTFAADSAAAEQNILLAGGFYGIGFSDSATMSGTLTARLGAKTGYDTSDTDEVAVVVTSGPAWVIKLTKDAYRFDEDGGGQNIELVATAASAAIPAPSLDRVNKSALHIAINTTGGTAEAYVDVDDPGDYQNIAETLYFPPSTCTADPNADNVLVCRSNATFTPVDDTEAEPDETLNFNLAKVTGSSPAIHIQGPGPDRTVSTSSKTYPATIVDDDFGVTGVAVTSTPQQATDTYGAWEHIELSVSFNKPVTVTGAPTFSFDLGGTTTTAAYQGGSGTGTLVFSYQVMPDDADSNGIAWAADALAGGTIVEMGGTATPTLTVAVQGALSDHKVDGTQTASGTATVSTVAVTSTPLLMASGSTSADTYGVGETIEFTVTFSEAVTVTGDPQFGFSMSNPPDRLADYDQAASTATALVFRYTVQAADQDTDGIWVGDQSRTLKLDPDDRILTMSNSLPASLTHGEEGTKGSHKVDGSRGTSSTSAPGAPGDLRPAPGDGRVTLAWTAPANTGGAAILKYQYRARRTGTAAWTPDWTDVPDGSDSGSSAADETRVTVSGLTNGTEYRFEVRAVNSIGGGTAAWKNDTPVAAPAQVPGRPRNLLAASGNAQVTLTWEAPLDDGGAAISRYEYRHAQGTSVPASVLWQPAGLNFRQTVTGLVNDRQYTFEVRAANSAGEGPPATIQARPTASANAPSAPRFLKAVTTDRQVMLSWFAPARDGGSSITEYQYRHASGTSVPDDTPWSSAGRRLHAGSGSLTNGQRYTFQVRAVAAVAGPAASVTATPSANPVRRLPGAVSGLTATAGAYGDERRRRQYGRVTLNWNPPAVDDNSVLERFEYRYADSDSELPARWLQGSSNTTNVTIDRLKVVTDYVFEVRAVNLEGPGPAVRRSIRTPPAPEVGMSLAASRRTAIEGEALTFEVRRANRLENPAAFVLVGVTDSAFPGISALGGPVGGDGAGVRIVKFQPDATSATGTVRVEFDGARPSTRTLTITLQGINSPDYFGTPVRLDITVTDRDAGLRVRDARVREGPGAMLAFSVTLDRRRDREVAVNYATSDGTATQGDDYTRTAGTLVFSAGERSKTVSVPVVDDAHNESSETLTLTLSNARGAVIDDGTAVGTIVNSDPMPDAWLSRFGRAASDQVVQAIGRRLEGAARESHLTVMGWRADTLFDSRRAGRVSGEEPGHEAALESPRFGRDGAELRAGGTPGAPGGFMAQGAPGAGAFQMTEGAPDALRGAPGVVPVAVHAPAAVHAPGARGRGGPWADMLRGLLMKVGAGWDVRVPGLRDMVKGSSFYYGYSSDAGPLRGMNRLTAWGEGASTRFSGAEGKLSLDGEVNTAIVGADGEWGRWLAGVALSYSEGEGDYRQNSAKGSAVSSTLTGVNPYARYRLDERTSLWGTFGYGRGRLTLTPKEAESSLETDMTNVMAAFGGRSVLSMRTGETGQFELALRSDAMLTDTTSAAVTGLAAGEGATNRIRLILEGSGSLPAFGGVLAPKVEAGLRYDGGDAETGAGLEVGGGLAYDMRRLTVKVDGRVLLTHQDRDYEEWGYSLSFLYQPAKNGRGLRLEGGSQWGVAQSGVHNLWSLQNAGGLASGAHTANEQRYTAELGYGFGVRRLWYPYIATESGGASSRSLRFGLKLNAGSDLEAGLEIGRRAHAFGRIENDIRLQLRARW